MIPPYRRPPWFDRFSVRWGTYRIRRIAGTARTSLRRTSRTKYYFYGTRTRERENDSFAHERSNRGNVRSRNARRCLLEKLRTKIWGVIVVTIRRPPFGFYRQRASATCIIVHPINYTRYTVRNRLSPLFGPLTLFDQLSPNGLMLRRGTDEFRRAR